MYKNIVLWGQKRKKVEHDFSYVFVALFNFVNCVPPPSGTLFK